MSPGDNRRNSSSLGEQNFGPNDGQLSTTNEYIQELSRQNNQLRHHHLQQQQQQHQQALQLLQLQQQQQQQQFTTPVIYTLPHHTTQTQIFLQQPYTVSQPAAILQTGLASTLPHQQQIFATGIGATPLNNNIILNMTPQLSHLTAPALGLTNQIAPSPHYSADGSAPALRQVLLSQQNENLILEQQLEALQEKKEALQKLKDLHNKGKSESKKEEKKSAKAEANQNLPKLNEQFTVKNLKPRRKPYSFGVPTDIDEIVLLASSLVAQEVRDCHFGFSGGQQQEIEDRAVNAAAALEAFASDVILPNLQASYAKSKEVENLHDKKDTYHSKASSSKNKSCISKDKGQRILVAALLALREVLMMNAERIFGPNFAKKSTNDAIQKSESYVMKIQTFSTSIILNAICNLPKLESDEITKQFLQASSKYDERDQEFASCLKRMDVRAVGTLPNGRLLKRHENLQFKVSYNVGRLEHPLIKEQLYRVRRIRSNAAYVCILDDQQGLKHPKQKLRAKNAIQKCRKENRCL